MVRTRRMAQVGVAVLAMALLCCAIRAESPPDDAELVRTLQALVASQESQIETLTSKVRIARRESRQHYLSEHGRLRKQERAHQEKVERISVALLQLKEDAEDETENNPEVTEESGDHSDVPTNSASKKPGDEAMRKGPPPRREELQKLTKYVDQVKDSSYETFRQLKYQLWVFQHRYKRKMRALKIYRKKLRDQQKSLEEYEIRVKNHLKGMRARMKAFMQTVDKINRHNKELGEDLTDDKDLSAKFKTQLDNQLRRIEDLQQQMEKMLALDTRLRGEQRDFTNDLATLKSTLEDIDPVQKRLWSQEELYQKAGVKDGQHLRQLLMGIQLLKRKHQSWQTNLLRKVTGKLESSQDMINTSIKRAGMLVEQARGEAARQLKKLVGSQLGDRVKGVEADLFEKEVSNELKKEVAPQLTQYLSRQKLLLDELSAMKKAAKTGKWEAPEALFHEEGEGSAPESATGAAKGDAATSSDQEGTKETSDTASKNEAPAATELLQLQASTEGNFIPVNCRCVQEEGQVPESGAPMHCFCDNM